ncbi:MAG: EamA family transporter RarD [Paracoccaceae bacterium]|nr:EamA family transporter RarD [Paracoccaceae bacterium]
MTHAGKGVAAMVIACTIWGLSPIYYRALAHVPPFEVLAHRVIWSAVTFGVVLWGQGRLRLPFALLRGTGIVWVLAASVLISVNWFSYIWSVQAGHVTEASLGYFLFPLVSVFFGRVIFAERLGQAQSFAVALSFAAVCVLSWGLSAPPWVALAIACSFAGYGVFKKKVAAGPIVSVTAEVIVILPLAILWLVMAHMGAGVGPDPRPGGLFGHDLGTSLGLMLTGVLTAGPLILFSQASQRVTMATLGFVQYINPVLQFFCATVLFAEPFGPWHMVSFAMIWGALVIYSIAAFRQEREVRKSRSNVGTSGTTVV